MHIPAKTLIYSGTSLYQIHTSYIGDQDVGQDIGLIITPNLLSGNLTSAIDFMRFYVGSMVDGKRNYIYGQGYNSHDYTGSGIMRFGEEYVNWYGTYHFFAEESGGTRTCSGDSGGPWVRKDATLDAITGIHSSSEHAPNSPCTGSGGRMRACRVNQKTNWISAVLVSNGMAGCVTSGSFTTCY